jgi:hypothetical protein
MVWPPSCSRCLCPDARTIRHDLEITQPNRAPRISYRLTIPWSAFCARSGGAPAWSAHSRTGYQRSILPRPRYATSWDRAVDQTLLEHRGAQGVSQDCALFPFNSGVHECRPAVMLFTPRACQPSTTSSGGFTMLAADLGDAPTYCKKMKALKACA